MDKRFTDKFDEVDGCLLWNSTLRNGYPVYRFEGRMIPAHRMLTSSTARVSRTCGNKTCIAPSHLKEIKSKVDTQTIKTRLSEPYWGIGERLAEEFGVSPALISKLRSDLADTVD